MAATVVYSAEYLKKIRNKNKKAEFEREVERITNNILMTARHGDKTHIHRFYGDDRDADPVVDGETPEEKLVNALKQRFPECSVEYREAVRLDGDIERGIIVSWD